MDYYIGISAMLLIIVILSVAVLALDNPQTPQSPPPARHNQCRDYRKDDKDDHWPSYFGY